MSLPWLVAWAVLFGVGAAMEGVALARGQRGDTLSEQVWAILRRGPLVLRWLVAGILLWVLVHFVSLGRFG